MWLVRGTPTQDALSTGKRGVSLTSPPPPPSLANSELHVFRGHQPSETGFIMGHEFVGTVTEVGSAVQTLQVGDRVVSPFTVSWYVCRAAVRLSKARSEGHVTMLTRPRPACSASM